MSISYRRPQDKTAADQRAKGNACGAAHVPPSVIQAWRIGARLSMTQAAALLGYQATWWQWREAGHMTMDPTKFAAAQAAFGALPARPALRKRIPLADRLTALEARVTALEGRRSADLL